MTQCFLLVLALVLQPSNAWLLAGAWIYLALMTREFFAAAWLKRHPVVYMTSHMVILPLVDLYATACDWGVAGGGLFCLIMGIMTWSRRQQPPPPA